MRPTPGSPLEWDDCAGAPHGHSSVMLLTRAWEQKMSPWPLVMAVTEPEVTQALLALTPPSETRTTAVKVQL